jgi:hypothetical protein
MKSLLLCLLVLAAQSEVQGSDPSLEAAKVNAHRVETMIRGCDARVLVGQFTEGRKHPVWEKQSFGPPSDVTVDLKKNGDSLLYPYLVVVEFTLWLHYGDEFNSRDGALQSTADKPLFKSRNRNIYLLGADGLRLKTTEVFEKDWSERPRWDDACWDHINLPSVGEN